MDYSPSKGSIAVIGAGYWGKNLVRNYHEMGVLRTICDINEQASGTGYPDVLTTTCYQDVLADPQIRGIVLAVPAAMHFSFAREALFSGKDVYVEKPLALDVNDARELKDIAEKNARILMVGHLLQYHPVFNRLREIIMAGDLGRIYYIYSNRLNFGKIRREEDILWSFAPHDISMILSLANEMPETVTAIGGNYLHKKIADVTTTHLSFSSGLKAHVFVSWLHPFKEQMLVVVGEKGMAVFNDTQPWAKKLQLYPHNIQWNNGIPVPDKKQAKCVMVEEAEPLLCECEHFIECIQSRNIPRTDATEGIGVLRVLKAGQDSLEHEGKTIRFNADSPDYFVHETSEIDQSALIGAGTKIWHFSHILSGSKISEGCNIGQNVVIGPDVTIGKNCRIQNNVSIYKGVTLEDNVFCGPSMVFTNVCNPRAGIKKMDQSRPTLVKKGATIGANATIVCGTTLGRFSFIAAGAVVTKDVPAHALVAGNPGRQTGWVCECAECLDNALICTACGKKYVKDKTGVRPE